MAYSINIYEKTGKKISTFALNKDKFAKDKINQTLVHEYYILQQANARQNSAHTKGRGEVAGSGKKLYKQKGTGSARVGDRRSPIRVGGGVSRGPKNERNYKKNMTKKSRQIALNSIISLKAEEKNILGIKDFKFTEAKTKKSIKILDNLKLSDKKVLLVLDQKDENTCKSFRNIPKLKYILLDYLNPVDLLSYEKVLVFESALKKLSDK